MSDIHALRVNLESFPFDREMLYLCSVMRKRD